MASFPENLANNEPQLGLCIMYPSPGVVERIGGDWDWVWIDGQHGELGYGDVLPLVRACDLIQRPAFVRVPGHEFGLIGQALDTGASGVIVPCVDTPRQAREAVNAAKFPPLGKRSYGARRPIDFRGRGYAETANRDIMLIVQIESPEAIENVDAIAATPGVDALFLGPDDLMLRRGFSMTAPRSKEMMRQDMETMSRACRENGKIAVTVGMGAEMLELSVETGYGMIVAGGDVPFLANSSKKTSDESRAILQAAKGGRSRVNGVAREEKPGAISSPY